MRSARNQLKMGRGDLGPVCPLQSSLPHKQARAFETENLVSRQETHIEAGKGEEQVRETEHGGHRLGAVVGFVFIHVTHTLCLEGRSPLRTLLV